MKRRIFKRMVYSAVTVIFIYLFYAVILSDEEEKISDNLIKSEQFNEPDFIDSVHNDEDIKAHKPKEQPATPAKQVTKEAEHKKSVPNRGASPKSVKNDEEKILKKMEQSMLKNDNFATIENVPKPKDIIKDFKGPVRYKPAKNTSRNETNNIKLLILARKNSGYPVIKQFLNEDNFFFHGEPKQESNLVANLFNCVLDPNVIKHFTLEIVGKFGDTSYFKEKCLLDSDVICTDPLSYEKSCKKYSGQVLRSRDFTLEFVEDLLLDNKDMKAIFLVRDPRGTIRKKNPVDIKPICERLQSDIKLAIKLQSELKGQFALARYEDIAREPKNETFKLFKNLNLEYILDEDKENLKKTEDNETTEDVWHSTKNSLTLVNKWKQALNIKQIKLIETQCLEALTSLEYPLLGIPLSEQ